MNYLNKIILFLNNRTNYDLYVFCIWIVTVCIFYTAINNVGFEDKNSNKLRNRQNLFDLTMAQQDSFTYHLLKYNEYDSDKYFHVEKMKFFHERFKKLSDSLYSNKLKPRN